MSDPMDPMADTSAIDEALAFLRGHLSGTLRFESEFRPLKIVVMPDGRLVASAMVAMIRSLDTTLYLPDEEETSMHLQVTLTEIHDRGDTAALCDRWRIYHGEPPDVRWALLSIDAARYGGLFFDGDAMTRPNPLAALEPAICRGLNARHTDLVRAACRVHREIVIEKPIVVGVDPFGLDVRGAFDVVRLDDGRVITSEDDALAALRALAEA